MIFWLREIAGWLFVGAGLWAFYQTYFTFLKNGQIVQAMPTTAIGVVLFRGGIHLLKVAVAARICRRESDDAKPRTEPRTEPRRRRTVVPAGTRRQPAGRAGERVET